MTGFSFSGNYSIVMGEKNELMSLAEALAKFGISRNKVATGLAMRCKSFSESVVEKAAVISLLNKSGCIFSGIACLSSLPDHQLRRWLIGSRISCRVNMCLVAISYSDRSMANDLKENITYLKGQDYGS